MNVEAHVLILHHTGYINNAIAPIPNYKSAAYYANSIIMLPTTDCSSNNLTLAWQLYNDGRRSSASRCAVACDAYSAQAQLNATAAGTTNPVSCKYFNTFILNKGKQALDRCVICTANSSSRAGLQRRRSWIVLGIRVRIPSVMALRD